MLEILIIEDGPSDRTQAICESVARRHPNVTGLHEGLASGKAAALNRAVKHANDEVLLFLDANTYFDPDLLLR